MIMKGVVKIEDREQDVILENGNTLITVFHTDGTVHLYSRDDNKILTIEMSITQFIELYKNAGDTMIEIIEYNKRR